ncbi:MAG: sulfurtransferase-like selenium metabolism protein YedF [Desulfovibrionaceae bacterium]|nr:sulfurtransferase-like selenium metabolism protein YedF [Desulfovibrionaceae bacterium]
MSRELNCLGLVCPEPVLRCRDLLAKDRPAEFTVLVDFPASVENVSRFLGKNGYSVTSEKLDEKKWRLSAVLTDPSASSEEIPDCPAPTAHRRTAVLITTETLGRGDDTLGTGLMGNFLATLPEMGEELWRVILLNGGVKLACTEGKALDALKKMAADGVSVFVCGTCLNHYGLLEKKQVGETTNMLDIVTSLAEADKVIRP